jgi:hypothetical protein
MNDRTMLELAAKAAGISYSHFDRPTASLVLMDGALLNPLTDDGDALRLAVKLRMALSVAPATLVRVGWMGGTLDEWFDKHDGGPYAATRRAIVRAAAEIGKAMP